MRLSDSSFLRFSTMMIVHNAFDLVKPTMVNIAVNRIADDVYHGVAHVEGTNWHFEVRLTLGFLDLIVAGERMDLCGFTGPSLVPFCAGVVSGCWFDQGLVVADVDDLLQYV